MPNSTVARNLIWVYVLTSHCNFKTYINVPHVNKTVTDFGGIYTDIPPSLLPLCQTIVICIDFSKAFDVVHHDKLFSKLYAYGIRGTVLQWTKNLFTGRTFCTRINHLLSEVVNLLSGVIQGSVIGPLCFLSISTT